MRLPSPPVIVLSIAALSGISCSEKTPAGNVELQAILAAPAPEERRIGADTWADVQRFYTERQLVPAWTTRDRPAKQSAAALATLAAASDHGLSHDYADPDLKALVANLAAKHDDNDPTLPKRLAEFDVRLTSALLHLGRDVATGVTRPDTIDPRWNVRRSAPDLVAALTRARENGMTGFLDDVQPRHPEYRDLQKALASLRGQATKGWPAVPRAPSRLGRAHPAVVTLRHRLANEGYLPEGSGADSTLFDAEVQDAVRRFQEHHGLKATGELDAPTLAAMNVPLETRLIQVVMNLERWRWLPDDLGARHFIVNVPYFHLIAREQGKPVLDIRVIVGKSGNETPLFSDEMTHVVFSPYWNIPETIAVEETVPAMVHDPGYLSRNEIEIVNASGRVVSSSSIPWDDLEALRTYSFRQRPGARNALGFVKFLFPNRHNVYLHDTPTDRLFARIGRAFSHGCVRVEEPETLAAYVLRDQPKWTGEAISAAMRSGQEQHVKLAQPIPVHLIYMTTWVDDRGGLHFQDDVYGYDAKQARAIAR